MDENKLNVPSFLYTTMRKVDVRQVFISTAAIFGIGFMCINFNEKVFKAVRHLISALFPGEDINDETRFE